MTDTPDLSPAALEALADKWLVWSFEHRAYWRANRSGYCSQVWGAGLYTEGEAKEIEADANAHGDRQEQARPAWPEVQGFLAAASGNTVAAATLRALAARAERAEALNKEAKSVLAVFSYAADLLEVKATESGYIWGNSDYRSWISSYFRPKAFASARALFAHFSAARTELEPDA